MTERRLRVGLLVDDTSVSKYVFDLAAWAAGEADIEPFVLISQHAFANAGVDRTSGGDPLRYLLASIRRLYGRVSKKAFALTSRWESARLAHIDSFRHHRSRFDLRSLGLALVNMAAEISPSGLSCRFSEDSLERVRNLQLDVMVRCGGHILRGSILTAARLGILSFHHADNRINRGTPAAFWEVYLRQPSTGFTIQRLTEDLDGGDVLMRGRFPTRHFHALNEAALFEKSNHYMKRMIRQIADSGQLPTLIAATPYSHRLFRYPGLGQLMRYWALTLGGAIRKKAIRWAGFEYRWTVNFVREPWRHASLWRGRRTEAPPGNYFADPFLISRDGSILCFVEEYVGATGRGRISVLQVNENGTVFLGPAVAEPFHMSFPFLFEHEGELYMCPETSQNKDIRVYRCVEFPLVWKLEKVLMRDLSAADTMLFENDGRWWMLTNIDPCDVDDNCSELSIFCSDSPLSDNWHPHTGNPVIVDSLCARNAGLIRDGSHLFRVAQEQGFDQYGQAITINRIRTLTVDRYAEDQECRLGPDFNADARGIHHLSSLGSLTAFDAERLRRVSSTDKPTIGK